MSGAKSAVGGFRIHKILTDQPQMKCYKKFPKVDVPKVATVRASQSGAGAHPAVTLRQPPVVRMVKPHLLMLKEYVRMW